jgi:iron complex transport system permease protein
MSRKFAVWGGAGVVLLLLSVTVSLFLGSERLPMVDIWGVLLSRLPVVGGLFEGGWAGATEPILLKIRLPRVVLAVLVGACLSLAGAGFQGVLRNPLADPYTLGVASGAAVGAALMIHFGLNAWLFGMWTTPIFAFVFAMLSLLLVLRLANIQGQFRLETVILSGVVVSAFLSSVVSLLVSMSDRVVNEIVFWLMGSLAMRGWPFALVLLPYLAIGAAVLFAYGRTLNLFALGERQAAHLGVNVTCTRLVVLVISTLLAAAAVSVVGTIGFVGLVVPHMVRLLAGPDYRVLLPLSALYGGIYVLWADTLARTVLSPAEIPLGVVTAFLGAPFFAWLLRRSKQESKG